jgi:hypothetical protein
MIVGSYNIRNGGTEAVIEQMRGAWAQCQLDWSWRHMAPSLVGYKTSSGGSPFFLPQYHMCLSACYVSGFRDGNQDNVLEINSCTSCTAAYSAPVTAAYSASPCTAAYSASP